MRPDFTFLTGWDVVLVPMMLVGADGGTNATSGVVPELMRRLYDDARKGIDGGDSAALKEAMKLQLRLIELFDTMIYSADFPEGFRAAVDLRGFKFGRGRQPLSEKQQVDRAALQRQIQCILADFGATQPPAEGCPPRRELPSRARAPERRPSKLQRPEAEPKTKKLASSPWSEL
jgi:4-hydroxy-tetrahydrodipicolinate synthase